MATNQPANTRTLSLRDWILAALFAALTAVGAKISFPLGVTNITLQMFFALLAGILLGSRTGALSQSLYLILGLIGLPVFTSGSGLGYVLHPSFGFILGFIAMAWIVGLMTKLMPNLRPIIAVSLGTLAAWVALYAIGLPYMGWALARIGNPLTIKILLKAGMLVYLPGDLLKIALAVPLGVRLLPIIRQYQRVH